MEQLLSYITERLQEHKLRYEIHHFDSGCKMVDIWIQNEFYCIQLEQDRTGISRVTAEDAFCSIPDLSFTDTTEFQIHFEKIIVV